MKLQLGVLGIFVGAAALLSLGACSDDTTPNGTGNTSTSSSSSSGTSGMTSTSSSSGTSGMTSTSSSSSGSSGMTSSSGQSCSDCTNISTGAYATECKAQTAACNADQACKDLFDCSFTKCSTNAEGGCCTLKCATDLNTPQASKDKFLAMDKCIYCDTCTTICEFDMVSASGYCKSISGTMACP